LDDPLEALFDLAVVMFLPVIPLRDAEIILPIRTKLFSRDHPIEPRTGRGEVDFAPLTRNWHRYWHQFAGMERVEGVTTLLRAILRDSGYREEYWVVVEQGPDLVDRVLVYNPQPPIP
jgi:hypothetical protein